METGQRIGADYVVSGAVVKFGRDYNLTLRLHSTKDAKLLASTQAKSTRAVESLPAAAAAACRELLGELAHAATTEARPATGAKTEAANATAPPAAPAAAPPSKPAAAASPARAACARGELAACEKACAADDATACFLLGAHSELAWSVPYDPVQATTQYLRACESGVNDACAALGIAIGLGVDPDPRRAFQLFDHACTNGNVVGCENLQAVYTAGLGTEASELRASEAEAKASHAADPW